jgi:hypothetical protein
MNHLADLGISIGLSVGENYFQDSAFKYPSLSNNGEYQNLNQFTMIMWIKFTALHVNQAMKIFAIASDASNSPVLI